MPRGSFASFASNPGLVTTWSVNSRQQIRAFREEIKTLKNDKAAPKGRDDQLEVYVIVSDSGNTSQRKRNLELEATHPATFLTTPRSHPFWPTSPRSSL
jgi:hypothetical protein